MAIVCDHLPEDWEIILIMSRGAADYTLMDPKGASVDDEEWYCDDATSTEQLIAMVNLARVSDGLETIELKEDGSVRQ